MNESGSVLALDGTVYRADTRHVAAGSFLSECDFSVEPFADIDSVNGSFTVHKKNTIHSTRTGYTGSEHHQEPLSAKRRLLPEDPHARYALAWSAVQMIVCIGIEVAVLVIHDNYLKKLILATKSSVKIQDQLLPDTRALLIYQGLFIAAQLFQFLLFCAAIYAKSVIEVMSTTFFNAAVLGYTVLQYRQGVTIGKEQLELAATTAGQSITWPAPHPTKPEEIALIAIMGVFVIGWIYFAIRLYRSIGWSIFKELGADIRIRKQLTMYHIFFMLAKLCYFFYVCFDIQYLVIVLLYNKWSSTTQLVTHAAIAMPCTIILLFVSYVAMRRENKIFMICTLLGLAGGIGYLAYKLYDLQSSPASKYKGGRNSLFFFEIITIILTTLTLITGIICYFNFGKGLREHLDARPRRTSRLSKDDGF